MSNIKFDKWLNPDNTENYKCRAWVNFDGTTSPGTIRASGNVSSVTRNGTGDYTVNFATALVGANYSMNVSASSDAGGAYANQISVFSQTNSPFKQAPTTTTARFVTRNNAFAFHNPEYLCVAIFR
jgi:hypothetical protein